MNIWTLVRSKTGMASGAWVLLIAISLMWMNDYQVLILGTVAISAIAGVGMNVLLGLSGQVSLGHAAFYAIGSYAASLLAMQWGLDFYLASLCAALISGVFGLSLALPALRLRGPYLAMVSIAFGYFIEQGIANWKDLTGGWNGIMGIPGPSNFQGQTLGAAGITAWAAVIGAALVLAYDRFVHCRWGLMMRAAKDSEIASESLGMRLMVIRVLAFALSAAITGWAGAWFAALQGFISPESFPFFQSIIFLLIVLVGGKGHPLAPLLGAVVVVGLPESIAFLAQYRLMFFGLSLMLVLWLAPHGLMGGWSRLRRRSSPVLDDAETTPAAWLNGQEAVNPSGWAWQDPGSPHPPLVVERLGIQFGGNAALTDIELHFEAGQVTSLIGPNGAGKTTLINVIGGFYQASQGRVVWQGIDITQQPIHQLAKLGIARTFQTSQLFGEMTVLENIVVAMYQGYLFKTPGLEPSTLQHQRALQLLAWVGYQGDPWVLAAQLPHVDRRLVEIARALAAKPRYLFLDEPAAGLSKSESQRLGQTLRQIASLGVGVVLVEHDMSLVMEISDVIHVLESGRWIASGRSQDILHHPQVRQAYLGSIGLDTKRTGAPMGDAPTAVRAAALSRPESDPHPAWLHVHQLSAHHGAAAAIQDIGFQLSAGRCLAILGANGAGKSTLMRSIAGLHAAKSGEIVWQEQGITSLPAHEIVKLGITLIPEGRQVFTELSVKDNICLGAYATQSLSEAELNQLFDVFPALKALKDRKAGSLSGGEQQMLAFARGLAARPSLLMLDEPSLGLAPVIVQELFERMSDLKRQGMTLLLVDQMAGLAMSISDEVQVLAAGSTQFKGTPQALMDSGQLEESYLNHENSAASPSI